MKVLVIGPGGFLGRYVITELLTNPDLEILSAGRGETTNVKIDLLDKLSIRAALQNVRPDVIINCAGIVVNNEEAHKNVEFTKNLLDEITAMGRSYPKVITTGSAAEYGIVDNVDTPVGEDSPLRGTSNYARSKVEEVALAQDYAKKYDLDVTIARIFNPIGPSMGDKFLISNLLRQVRDIDKGLSNEIRVSRLDAKRDYVDIRDIAKAIHAFVVKTNSGHHVVQNVGSGHATTNKELLDMLLDHFELNQKPTIIETQDEPEPSYAACADIRRIKNEFDWSPQYDLNATMENIIHGQTAQ